MYNDTNISGAIWGHLISYLSPTAWMSFITQTNILWKKTFVYSTHRSIVNSVVIGVGTPQFGNYIDGLAQDCSAFSA